MGLREELVVEFEPKEDCFAFVLLLLLVGGLYGESLVADEARPFIVEQREKWIAIKMVNKN